MGMKHRIFLGLVLALLMGCPTSPPGPPGPPGPPDPPPPVDPCVKNPESCVVHGTLMLQVTPGLQTVAPGTEVTLKAVAQDSLGRAVSYDWSVKEGSVTLFGDGSDQVRFTAPLGNACPIDSVDSDRFVIQI